MPFEQIGAVLKDVSQYIGWITVIITAVIAISKRARKKLVGVIRKNSSTDEIEKKISDISKSIDKMLEFDKEIAESNKQNEEVLRAILRDSITRMYYKNVESKSLKLYEKEDLMR